VETEEQGEEEEVSDTRWDVENAIIPIELTFDVGIEARLVYAYALSFSDSAGVCNRVYLAASRAGLDRPQASRAIQELVDKGFIELTMVPDTYSQSTACRLLHYKAPLRCERLMPDVWRELRAAVFKRDAYNCQYCGAHGGDLECDHVVPISKGGTNEMGNLVTACAKCNREKRAKILPLHRREAAA
jgi:5-methylcytosine-specific restriction endonuclease McrA